MNASIVGRLRMSRHYERALATQWCNFTPRQKLEMYENRHLIKHCKFMHDALKAMQTALINLPLGVDQDDELYGAYLTLTDAIELVEESISEEGKDEELQSNDKEQWNE